MGKCLGAGKNPECLKNGPQSATGAQRGGAGCKGGRVVRVPTALSLTELGGSVSFIPNAEDSHQGVLGVWAVSNLN